MSVHHHLFVRPSSQRTGPNMISSVQEMETKGRRREEGRREEGRREEGGLGLGRGGGGGLFLGGGIFDTLMNSFKWFSKYGLMRAGRGCHLGFICKAFP